MNMLADALYHIAVLMPEDGLGSNVAGPLDVFNLANEHRRHSKPVLPALCRWSMVTPGGGSVRLSSGLQIQSDGGLESAEQADVIVVPGINYQGAKAFSRLLDRQGETIEWLRACSNNGALMTSSCTGAFLLAEAGLLNGRRATTSWWAAHLFSRRYPQVIFASQDMLTEDAGIMCSGAATSYLNLAIKIIEQLGGSKLANQCAKTILIDNLENTQTPYMSARYHTPPPDEIVSRAQIWMQRNLHDEVSLEAVAAYLSISVRTLIRHFKTALGMTPTTYLQRLRVDTAKRLLETTKLKVDEIILRVGYSDTSSFRRLFYRETQLSPRDYRKQFAKRERPNPIATRDHSQF